MLKEKFRNTKSLLKLAWRGDRVKLPIWILSITMSLIFIILGNGTLNAEEMKSMASVAIASDGMRFMVAPISGHMLDHLGAFVLFRMSFLLAIIIGIMNIQLVIRHTRQNEENGCSELIASTVVGKNAPLTAALLLAFFTNLTLGVFIMIAFLLTDLPLSGTLIASFGFAGFGFLVASIAGLFGELSETSRGASGYSSMTLAVIYLINAFGNALGIPFEKYLGYESHPIVWFSPLGWIQQTYPFDKNVIWPLIPLLISTILIIFVSLVVIHYRDVGSGILPARKGRSAAKSWMLSPFGFAVKLQRPLLIGWMIPIIIFGLVFGSASQDYGSAIQETDLLKEALSQSDYSFLFMIIGVLTSIIAFYTLQSFFRIYQEEVKGLAEGILATPTRRSKYLLSHIMCSVFGSFLLLTSLTFAVLATTTGPGDQITLIKYTIQNGTALLFLLGIAIIVYGFVPKWSTTIAWGVLAISFVFGPFFGNILQLPDALLNISPFTHIGFHYSSDNWLVSIVLLASGVLLSLAGINGFTKRNII